MTTIEIIMRADWMYLSHRAKCPECGRRRVISTWAAWYTIVIGPPFWMGTCKRSVGEMCHECAMDRKARLEEEMES